MKVVADTRQIAFIAAARVAHLATVDARGEPHVMPVCYAYDGDRFYIAIDEKPKRPDRKLRRVRNIEQTGRAALVIDRYVDADWTRLAWLMARGAVKMLSADDTDHARIVALLRERYPQYRQMTLERAPLIALTPERITSWGALDE